MESLECMEWIKINVLCSLVKSTDKPTIMKITHETDLDQL